MLNFLTKVKIKLKHENSTKKMTAGLTVYIIKARIANSKFGPIKLYERRPHVANDTFHMLFFLVC